MSKQTGFTLVELLIVISIIAILSVIGLVAYSQFMKSSRDAERQSDLKIIQSALEDYHADQLSYPSSLSVLTSGTRIYMNQVPNDPKSSPYPNYSYSASECTGSQCKSYCIFAQMEITPPVEKSDPQCRTFPPNGYNYGVTRP